MQPFEYVEARCVQEAVELLAAQPGEAQIIAGGTDLLSEIKDGVATPRRLISLAGIPGLHTISDTGQGLAIGAMATITQVAEHPAVGSNYTALGEAASGLATPQIRNTGTLGGNLNQRPRCWYYRHPLTVCLKKGGDHCYAVAGASKYLCVTGGDRCYIVHPSDTAVALVALDAVVEIAGPSGVRTLPLEDFFAGPGRDLARENVLGPGELVTRVLLPDPNSAVGPTGEMGGNNDTPSRSLYLKAREREAGDFALVSVAAAITLEGTILARASVVLGGVAPVPYRAREVEEYLGGTEASQVDAAYAGSLALPDARPMAENAYKVILARNLVKRAVGRLIGG